MLFPAAPHVGECSPEFFPTTRFIGQPSTVLFPAAPHVGKSSSLLVPARDASQKAPVHLFQRPVCREMLTSVFSGDTPRQKSSQLLFSAFYDFLGEKKVRLL